MMSHLDSDDDVLEDFEANSVPLSRSSSIQEIENPAEDDDNHSVARTRSVASRNMEESEKMDDLNETLLPSGEVSVVDR